MQASHTFQYPTVTPLTSPVEAAPKPATPTVAAPRPQG
jgi:hypothetical protein